MNLRESWMHMQCKVIYPKYYRNYVYALAYEMSFLWFGIYFAHENLKKTLEKLQKLLALPWRLKLPRPNEVFTRFIWVFIALGIWTFDAMPENGTELVGSSIQGKNDAIKKFSYLNWADRRDEGTILHNGLKSYCFLKIFIRHSCYDKKIFTVTQDS